MKPYIKNYYFILLTALSCAIITYIMFYSQLFIPTTLFPIITTIGSTLILTGLFISSKLYNYQTFQQYGNIITLGAISTIVISLFLILQKDKYLYNMTASLLFFCLIITIGTLYFFIFELHDKPNK